MKKYISLFLAIILCSFSVPVLADGDINVTLNGEYLSFDVPPQIINDRTMVPMRAIFEALGASVNWNGDTKTVMSEKDGTTISLTIDSSTMYVNGSAVTLDSPACIIDGRTLVPVRAISEAYNTTVDWNSDTKTVNITTAINNTNDTKMYSEFPEVPDFGALSNISAIRTMDGSNNSKSYLYSILSFSPSIISDYANILQENGFSYIGSFNGSDGKVLNYSNGRYSVSCGISGTYYMIMVSVK